LALERTLALIKPRAVASGLAGEILSRIHKAGFRIVAIRTVHLTKADVEGFYAVHRGKPFFEELTTHMSSGKIFAVVLEAENAVAKWREVMGDTDPAKAAPGTIRREFGVNIRLNSTHGSDSPENATFEIAYFFSPYDLA
jgi:nucleoside-diphosphate kinase